MNVIDGTHVLKVRLERRHLHETESDTFALAHEHVRIHHVFDAYTILRKVQRARQMNVDRFSDPRVVSTHASNHHRVVHVDVVHENLVDLVRVHERPHKVPILLHQLFHIRQHVPQGVDV